MEYSRYIKIIAITVIALVFSYVLFNYFVDSLSVFHQKKEPFESYSDVNERFLKSLYLEEYCSEINTIIFGDSRTAGYLTDDIEAKFQNNRSFNYGVQSDTLIGIYQKLKWLAGKKCLPERIIIPLSIDRIKLYDFADDKRLLMQENPAVLKKKGMDLEYSLRQWVVLKKYLYSSSIFIKNIQYLKKIVSDRSYHLKFLPSTGDIYYYFDHPCKKRPSEIGTIKLDSTQVDAFIDGLKSIYEYAQNSGIEVVLVWNPQRYNVQMSYSLESIEMFLRKIADISPYIYRLSLDDDKLKERNNYHDCNHFKKSLGRAVFVDTNNILTLDLISEFKDQYYK